jgi:hypothetical protein
MLLRYQHPASGRSLLSLLLGTTDLDSRHATLGEKLPRSGLVQCDFEWRKLNFPGLSPIPVVFAGCVFAAAMAASVAALRASVASRMTPMDTAATFPFWSRGKIPVTGYAIPEVKLAARHIGADFGNCVACHRICPNVIRRTSP